MTHAFTPSPSLDPPDEAYGADDPGYDMRTRALSLVGKSASEIEAALREAFNAGAEAVEPSHVRTVVRVEPLPSRNHARMLVDVWVSGEHCGSVIAASGYARDVAELATGEIDLTEVRKRWGFR
jgi:hypothetical protein